jgi:intein/homing endonuclease
MVVKIGDFIEKIDKTYNKKLKKYFKLGDQTYIDVNKNNENYEIYAVDWDGNYKWCELQAVTKHLPLVDGKRDNLIKITLESGREVTGTKAKSFLRFNEKLNKLEQCGGKDIQIGDYVPIMKKLNIPKNQQLNSLNIEEYFPKNKYLYGDEC